MPVHLLGVVTLPVLAQPKAPRGLPAGDVHGFAMWTLLALIGLHASSAMHHRFVRRDGVLNAWSAHDGGRTHGRAPAID